MNRAYLSLGSNRGGRRANLAEALRRLAAPDVTVRRLSSLYETEPQDLPGQPWFLNLVAEIDTTLKPHALLERTRAVEVELGRQRLVPKGPRTIDIDVLLYGDLVADSPALVLPHPRIAHRRFVLEPLAELAPDLLHPVLGKSIRELLQAVHGQQVRRVAPLAGRKG